MQVARTQSPTAARVKERPEGKGDGVGAVVWTARRGAIARRGGEAGCGSHDENHWPGRRPDGTTRGLSICILHPHQIGKLN